MPRILDEFISQPVFMSQSSALPYLSKVIKMVKGEDNVSFGEAKELRERALQQSKPKIAMLNPSLNGFEVTDRFNLTKAPKGSIAIISHEGVMSRNGGLSTKGIAETRKEIRLAGQNPNITGVLFKMHSGGGSAFSCEGICEDIGRFEKEYGKPIASMIDSQACSAGYFAIAKSPYIFAAGKSTEAGCIGTMITLYNYDEYFAEMGVKEIIINATNSNNKNAEYYNALQGDTEMMRKQILDPLNDSFLAAVKAGRRGKLGKNREGVLSGRTFYGQELVNVGLADKLGTESDALKYLEKKAKQFNKIKSSKKMEKDYSLLSDSDLAQEITNLEEAISNSTEATEGIEETKANLAFAKAVDSLRKLTIENTSQIATIAAKDGVIASHETEISQLKESNSESGLLKTQVATLTTERDEALQSVTDKDAEIATLTATIGEQTVKANEANTTIADLTQQNNSFEEFINESFGSGSTDAFKKNSSGGYDQPTGLEPDPSKYQTKGDRKRKAGRSADDILREREEALKED
jgi:protease-4